MHRKKEWTEGSGLLSDSSENFYQTDFALGQLCSKTTLLCGLFQNTLLEESFPYFCWVEGQQCYLNTSVLAILVYQEKSHKLFCRIYAFSQFLV